MGLFRRPEDVEQTLHRILARIEEKIIVPELGPCWLWQGGTQSKGYGTISLYGQNHLVHRVMLLIVAGALEEDTYACHRCDVRTCCRPQHLFPGTPMDNHLDMRQKGRHWVPGQPPRRLER